MFLSTVTFMHFPYKHTYSTIHKNTCPLMDKCCLCFSGKDILAQIFVVSWTWETIIDLYQFELISHSCTDFFFFCLLFCSNTECVTRAELTTATAVLNSTLSTLPCQQQAEDLPVVWSVVGYMAIGLVKIFLCVISILVNKLYLFMHYMHLWEVVKQTCLSEFICRIQVKTNKYSSW